MGAAHPAIPDFLFAVMTEEAIFIPTTLGLFRSPEAESQ
jgi:hypothetical protein